MIDGKRDRTLLAVTIGHGAHDAWYGVAPIMLASLSATMALSNQDIALMLLLYQVLSSLTQPFFGGLAERLGSRPLAVSSILWTSTMYTAALFVETKAALMALIFLAGLGSGAWHPQATAHASLAGGARRSATAASIFFLGGTLGSAFLGAALGGTLLANYGRRSLIVISALCILISLTVVRSWVPQRLPVSQQPSSKPRAARVGGDSRFYFLLALLLMATALRSLTQQSLNTFVPKYQQDLGVSPGTYGLLMSLNLFASALGGVAGSYLADRVGLRRVLVASLLSGSAALFAFMRGSGLPAYAAFVLAGFLYGPSHTLLVVAGQRQFPERMATMSGFFLGFNFVSGAGGTWLLGVLADRYGLGPMLGLLPWALLASAVLAFVALPASAESREPARSPQSTEAEVRH